MRKGHHISYNFPEHVYIAFLILDWKDMVMQRTLTLVEQEEELH